MSMEEYTSPVIAGHRGFKAQYTENTIRGFNKCYDTGATVIETDLWITKDNVIVISHDVSTKRVFCHKDGTPSDYNILDSYYDEIKDLVTIDSGEPIIVFKDLLRWFANYVEENDSDIHKLMLDIKRQNPTKIMKFILQDILNVKDSLGWWLHRLQFGLWDLNFVKYLNQDEFFQDLFNGDIRNKFSYKHFDIFHISVSWRDSVHYINYNKFIDSLPKEKSVFRFKITGVSLIYISTWSIGFLTIFLPMMQQQNLKLYSWTINSLEQFEYLAHVGKIADLPEFGVITDSPDVMFNHKNRKDFEDELSTELTRLTTSNNLLDKENAQIILTTRQRLLYFIYKSFNVVAGSKRVTDEEKDFSAFVDEDRFNTVKVNSLFIWVFSTCQKYGIF